MTANDTQLNDADALARFANLEADNVNQFRKRYPRFAPEDIWGDLGSPAIHTVSISSGQMPESVPTWKAIQRDIQELWRDGFPLAEIVQFIAMIAGMSNMSRSVEELLERIQRQGPMGFSLPRPEIFICQRGAMFLGVQPWRALFCGVCGKRFAADKPGRKYCSEECSETSRKSSKRVWWDANRAKGSKKRKRKEK